MEVAAHSARAWYVFSGLQDSTKPGKHIVQPKLWQVRKIDRIEMTLLFTLLNFGQSMCFARL